MNKIQKEYEKFVHITKTHDDWKSVDISRINLSKFLKKSISTLNKKLESLKENQIDNISIHNNKVKSTVINNKIKIMYDCKKSLVKDKKNKKINCKIENFNYIFSPYFINIVIKNNTVKKEPITINNYIEPKDNNIYHQKNLIKIGKNCNVSIIENFFYSGKDKYISNIYSNIYLGENSIVNYYCLQESNVGSIKIFHQKSFLGKNSKINYFLFTSGKGIDYLKKASVLTNENCKIDINNIHYTDKKEKKSVNFNVNHYIKNCHSNISSKGIFNSIKEGSIIGKINIKKNCSNSKAFFNSDNLITTLNTKVNIRPILKIYNKDVVCSHGTTIGYLGKEEKFYLQSRGIDIKESEQILKHCFIKPSIDLVRINNIKNKVKEILGLNGISI